MKKILIVCEKPSAKKHIAAYLKKHTDWQDRFQVCYDYFGTVIDSRRGIVPFYKHEDGWYLYGQPSGFEPLVLPDFDIPEDTYLAPIRDMEDSPDIWRLTPSQLEKIEQVYFVCGDPNMQDIPYADEVLAARLYMWHTGIKFSENCQCICYKDLSEKELAESFGHIKSFKTVYKDLKHNLIEKDFPYRPGYVNDFERVLLLSAMNLTQFCEYFHIKRRTAENWKYGISSCPEGWLELMEYKLLHEGII